MGPTWGLPGADRTQVGPMWASWTLLSRDLHSCKSLLNLWHGWVIASHDCYGCNHFSKLKLNSRWHISVSKMPCWCLYQRYRHADMYISCKVRYAPIRVEQRWRVYINHIHLKKISYNHNKREDFLWHGVFVYAEVILVFDHHRQGNLLL